MEPRTRVVTITVDFLNTLLRTGTAPAQPVDMPDDAAILRLYDYWAHGEHLVDVVVWSSTFDIVPFGAQPVKWAPTFEAVTA